MPATGRNLTGPQMWQHIQDLCKTFNIEIHLCEKPEESRGGVVHGTLMKPGARVGVQTILSRLIQVKKVDNAFLYAIALHEVGHIEHPSGLLIEIDNGMEQELAAWEWAEHHALDWTPEMQAAKDYGLMTHRLAEQQRSRFALTPPPEIVVVRIDPQAALCSEQEYLEKGRDLLRKLKL